MNQIEMGPSFKKIIALEMKDMKKIFAVIGIVILIACAVLGKDTEYALIGCVIVVSILFVFTFREIYKYNENAKEITDICFTLKRDNLISQIISCALFTYYLFNDISNNKLNISENAEFILSICMLIYIFIQVYIVLFHTPKLSTNGFLCSGGNFILFDKIKSIKSEDGAMFLYKKLKVEYDGDKSELFKADRFDYENIKKHLKTYGSFEIEEIK